MRFANRLCDLLGHHTDSDKGQREGGTGGTTGAINVHMHADVLRFDVPSMSLIPNMCMCNQLDPPLD